MGDYTAIVPNGPYRKEKLHLALQEAGEIIGDQFDCSTLRRDDYEFHMGKDEQSDVLQVGYVQIFRKLIVHEVSVILKKLGCLVGHLSNRTILPKICLTGQFVS